MTTLQTDVDSYIEGAHELAAMVSAVTDQIDEQRRIPVEVSNEIADRGYFRLLMPRSLGGAELEHPDFRRIVRIFAEADASVGWCINQNNVFSTNSVRVAPETADEIWTVWRNVVTNGPPMPQTRAEIVDGGYRLSGQWNFSSGYPHATWLAALTPVYEAGATEPSEMRTMLLPKDQADLVDIWQVGGLRGTGSQGFAIEDLFVPAARSYPTTASSREPGPLYVIPTTLLFCSGFATVALGASRAGLDAAIDLAIGKTQQGRESPMRYESTTHRMVGQAEAIWNSARAFLEEAAGAMWQGAKTNLDLTVEERVAVRLASTHAIRESARVVDIAYTLCGSSAIFAVNPIQRRFQDVHAITQQIQGRPTHYDTAGQYFLDLEPEGIF
jgi:alkylation response protein AidB-like acyl-CoA dehydrogenase